MDGAIIAPILRFYASMVQVDLARQIGTNQVRFQHIARTEPRYPYLHFNLQVWGHAKGGSR
jgi:hypothetical protein